MYDVIAGAALVVGGIVWAVRLEGRIDTHDGLFEERDRLYAERDADIKDRLVRIERKLDRQNGYTHER